jgi:hypothetical protein
MKEDKLIEMERCEGLEESVRDIEVHPCNILSVFNDNDGNFFVQLTNTNEQIAVAIPMQGIIDCLMDHPDVKEEVISSIHNKAMT